MKAERYLWIQMMPSLVFVSLMWIIWVFAFLLDLHLGVLGLYPRRLSGIWGIFSSPLIHGSLEHIISNTLAMIILPTLVFLNYPKSAVPLSIWLWLGSGFWTWCFAREAYHIGASGLVYGYASFVFFAGIFQKDRRQMALSFLIIFLYSGLLFGLIPDTGHISWESHLSGAIAGTGFAYFSRGWDTTLYENLELNPEDSEESNTEKEISLNHIYYTKPGAKHSERIKPS
ncbi:MAG: rhomboid family intramembrane serine protease [Microscillaceae bacterium]|nr:rhomboid family intramembrane serine protease [Microscillaceae bacterium]